MKCDQVVSMLDSLQDNELPTQTAAEINQHMKDCLPCAQEWESRLALRERMHALGKQIVVPAELIGGIEKHVQRSAAAPRRWAWGLAAAAAIVIISLSVQAVRPPQASATPTVADLVKQQSQFAAVGAEAKDPALLSPQAGFEVSPLVLPGWTLSCAQVVDTSDKSVRMARLIFTDNRQRSITCYQVSSGKVKAADLLQHHIGGKLYCCGQVSGQSVVYLPRRGHDFIMVGDLPQIDLIDLAQGT